MRRRCSSGSLTKVNLDGFELPVKKLKGTEPVESLNFSHRSLGPDSAVVIALLIGINSSLTNLNLNYNSIGPEGGVAIGEALRVNGSLTILSLDGNSIGEEGALAIIEPLKVNSSLTSLDLGDLKIGENALTSLNLIPGNERDYTIEGAANERLQIRVYLPGGPLKDFRRHHQRVWERQLRSMRLTGAGDAPEHAEVNGAASETAPSEAQEEGEDV